MKPKVILVRPAIPDDCRDLWRWRNNPRIREHFFDSEPVCWKDHKKWFMGKLNGKDTRIYIATQEEKRIGVIRFDNKRFAFEVSVNLNPDYLGKGLGSKLIKKGSRVFLEESGYKKPLVAKIKIDNFVSQKAFTKAGYLPVKKNTKFVLYLKGISR